MLRIPTIRRRGPRNGVLGGGANPGVPFSDDFSANNPRWYGPTWTVSGGACYNTPTGTEVCADGDMEAANLDNWVATLTPTTREKSGTQKHGGSQSLHLVTDASSEGALQTVTLGAAPKWVRFSGWLYRVATSLNFRATGGGFSDLIGATENGEWQRKIITGRTTSGTTSVIQALSSSGEGYADDYSVMVLSVPALFRTVRTSVPSVTAQVVLSTMPANTVSMLQAGLVINMDSETNPQNFVIAYYSGRDAKVYLDKCVAGVYTNLVSGAVTYGAAKILKVVKNGTTYQVSYDGSQVGTDQTITGMNGTRHGIFSTDGGAKLDNYSLVATPF